MDKTYANTVEGQKEMFYTAGNISARNMLKEQILKMEKTRSDMLSQWRKAGSIESEWCAIAEYDKLLEKQEEILRDLGGW